MSEAEREDETQEIELTDLQAKGFETRAQNQNAAQRALMDYATGILDSAGIPKAEVVGLDGNKLTIKVIE